MALPGNPLPALEHHLLGLLLPGKAHGYQLLEQLEQHPWCWEVRDAGSVATYQVLASLVKRGWLELEKVPAGTSQLRAMYGMASAGRDALWLATEASLREFPTSEAFRRGLAYAAVLSPAILAIRLTCAADLVASRLERYQPSARRSEPEAQGDQELEPALVAIRHALADQDRAGFSQLEAWLREQAGLLLDSLQGVDAAVAEP